ncbi:MAG: YeeE/YedE family protein [Deltaproteobacteria bacterium]|nr:YeeE/YedE family protein [Deltaproteobacteria bacterium]
MVASFAIGALFAVGLTLGGMTQPSKVVGFLDFFGNWDPSLAFVMGGAVGVYAIAYRLVTKRKAPVLTPRFLLPTRRDIDARLVSGSALFGVGWGLAGYCPGPGITSLGTAGVSAFVFVAAMFAGMGLFRVAELLSAKRASTAAADPAPKVAREH